MDRQDIIKEIKKYGLALDKTYTKDNENFLIICDAVTVNEICFRNVRNIHFIDNTMWIDKASIDIEDVKEFEISFFSIKYDIEDIKINAIEKDTFKLKEN